MNMFDDAINSLEAIKITYLSRINELNIQIVSLRKMRNTNPENQEKTKTIGEGSHYYAKPKIKRGKNISKTIPLKDTLDNMPSQFTTQEFIQACVPGREERVQKSAGAYLCSMVNKKKLRRLKPGLFERKLPKLQSYDPKKDPKFHQKDLGELSTYKATSEF